MTDGNVMFAGGLRRLVVLIIGNGSFRYSGADDVRSLESQYTAMISDKGSLWTFRLFKPATVGSEEIVGMGRS